MSADNQAVQSAQYGFTASETEMLIFTRQHLDAIFSGVLSNIAAGRIGYHITENTQFKLAPDFSSVVISERPNVGETPENNGAIRSAE